MAGGFPAEERSPVAHGGARLAEAERALRAPSLEQTLEMGMKTR